MTLEEQRAVLEIARSRLRWPTTPIDEYDVFHHYEDEELGFGPLYRACRFSVDIAPFQFELSLRWDQREPAKMVRVAARSHDDDKRWALFPDRATRDVLARFGFTTSYEIAAELAVAATPIVESLVGFASVPLRIVRDHEIASATWPRWHVWEAIAAERFDVLDDTTTPGRWKTTIDNDAFCRTIVTDDDLALIREWRARR